MKDLRHERQTLWLTAAAVAVMAWLLVSALAAQAAAPARALSLTEALTAPLIPAPLPIGFGLWPGALMALALYLYFHLFVRRR
jgi:hypothetical protein